jgi:uncharacterized protein (DUF1810 family)
MSAVFDPHSLARFAEAQEETYGEVLSELRRGRKRSHWMWYIFPQFHGLGTSTTSEHYAIKSVEEATAYLDHPILGGRLTECAEVTLLIEGKTASEIFGTPDNLKLRSCATLFAHVSPPGSVFHRLLLKYFQSEPDEKTLQLIAATKKVGE